MMIWNEFDFVEAEENKEKLKIYSDLLIRYDIYMNSPVKTIDGYLEYLNKIKKDIADKEYKKINTMLEKINSGKLHRKFFVDTPIVIYNYEVAALDKIAKKYTYNSTKGKKTREILIKYLFVWLCWQKAYDNRFTEIKEWATAKDEELFKQAEKSGDSGHRCDNFKLLIEDGYLEYKVDDPTEKRRYLPKLYFRVTFIKHDGKVAFEIEDYNNLYLNLVKHKGGKVQTCNCGSLYEFTRASKKMCASCAKNEKQEQTNECKKRA